MKTATLSEIATIHTGGRLGLTGNDFVQAGVPAYGAAGLNGFLDKAEYHDTNAVILSSIGARCGKCFLVSGSWTSLANTQVILPDPHRIDPRFLWYQLNDEARWHRSGSAQPFIKPSDVHAHEVHIPPLAEQRRIAAILDHADALGTKRRQVLTHLDALTQSIFHDMFGGLNPTKPLADSVAEFRYGTSSKSGTGGLPTLRIPNVIGGALDTSEIKTVKVDTAELARLTLCDGDLLFVRTNGNPDNVGRCSVFTHKAVTDAGHGSSPWIYASYLIRARLQHTVDPTFLVTYLATQEGRKQLRDRSKTSAGQYNINIEGIGSVAFPEVEFGQQNEFSARIAQIRTRRIPVERSLTRGNELFASLQSRAFREEL